MRKAGCRSVERIGEREVYAPPFTKWEPYRPISPTAKREVYRRKALSASIKKAQTTMPISRAVLTVGSIFLAFLYVYDACFGDNGAFAPAVANIVAHRWPEPDEFHSTTDAVSVAPADATPAARVRETFAMFMPGDTRSMRDRGRPLPGSIKPQG
jgi:hypothetical protein